VTPPEAEQFLRIEKLRRQIDASARAFVLRLVLALVVAFGVGVLIGRYG
jgi:hypothetical protein